MTPTPLFQSPSPEDFCDLLRDLQPALSLPLMVTAVSGPSETRTQGCYSFPSVHQGSASPTSLACSPGEAGEKVTWKDALHTISCFIGPSFSHPYPGSSPLSPSTWQDSFCLLGSMTMSVQPSELTRGLLPHQRVALYQPWRREWQPTLVFLPGESPWTEAPGGLQSMGSQRVGHDRGTNAFTFRPEFMNQSHNFSAP